jgi:hypothetical protein
VEEQIAKNESGVLTAKPESQETDLQFMIVNLADSRWKNTVEGFARTSQQRLNETTVNISTLDTAEKHATDSDVPVTRVRDRLRKKSQPNDSIARNNSGRRQY